MVRAMTNIHINVQEVDASFLPITRMLGRLADVYYKRWSNFPENPATEAERNQKEVALQSAGRFALVELAFQQKILRKDDQRIANTLRFYGQVLRKQNQLGEAIEQLEKANEIWDRIASTRDLFAAANEEAALFPSAPSRQKADGMLTVKNDLAVYYLVDGMRLRNAKEKDEEGAKARFAAAERLLLESLGEYGTFWPDHRQTGDLNFALGTLYRFWAEKKAGAEGYYRRALAIHEAADGSADETVRQLAGDLAGFLREEGNENAAAEIEQRYDLKIAPGR
jgi:hypothetical protein